MPFCPFAGGGSSSAECRAAKALLIKDAVGTLSHRAAGVLLRLKLSTTVVHRPGKAPLDP